MWNSLLFGYVWYLFNVLTTELKVIDTRKLRKLKTRTPVIKQSGAVPRFQRSYIAHTLDEKWSHFFFGGGRNTEITHLQNLRFSLCSYRWIGISHKTKRQEVKSNLKAINQLTFKMGTNQSSLAKSASSEKKEEIQELEVKLSGERGRSVNHNENIIEVSLDDFETDDSDDEISDNESVDEEGKSNYKIFFDYLMYNSLWI